MIVGETMELNDMKSCIRCGGVFSKHVLRKEVCKTCKDIEEIKRHIEIKFGIII